MKNVLGKLAPFIAGYAVEEITIGRSTASVYRVHSPDHVRYLKCYPVCEFEKLEREVALLDWLKARAPVASVLKYGIEDKLAYCLQTAVPGVDGVEYQKCTSPSELVEALAKGLRELHDIDWQGCPSNERLELKLKRAEKRVALNLVDESDFDSERQGRSAIEVLEQANILKPASEDLVFTHGDYCLPNVMFKDEQISGFIDLKRAGIGDRYNDLAIATRSIAYNMDAAGAEYFLKCYGVTTVDEQKIEYYRLLDELF